MGSSPQNGKIPEKHKKYPCSQKQDFLYKIPALPPIHLYNVLTSYKTLARNNKTINPGYLKY